MPEQTSSSSGLGDLLGLLGNNPLSGVGRSMSQFQRTVGDLVQAVERLEQTVTRLDAATTRLADTLERTPAPPAAPAASASPAANPRPRRRRSTPPASS
jgi:hypothetical protein